VFDSSPEVSEPPPSARKAELLEASYHYALEHGLHDLSLRPLAATIGSSPRVLLYLFGSKEGLVQALLARARSAELAALAQVRNDAGPADLRTVAATIWRWLTAPRHRALLALWTDAYARSLVDPTGPWAGFARQTVQDWLAVFDDFAGEHDAAERTLLLAVLRGALLDVLATGDTARVTRAVTRHLDRIPA
jgi:AcrR family transcriptional regulator